MLTGTSVYINVAALLCALIALPLFIGVRRRKLLDKNNLLGTLLLGFAVFLHGGFETVLRSSPHAVFSGYLLGLRGGSGEPDSDLWIYDLGYPPAEIGTFSSAAYRNLHITLHKKPVPEPFWDVGAKLYVKCDYRKWDLQIAHIEAVPTPDAKRAGWAGWRWDSDSEGLAWCLLEALLGLTAICGSVFFFRPRKQASQQPTIHPSNRVPNQWAVRIYSSVVLLILALCGFVRLSDWVFQHRAEALLRDIQELELRKSTWRDAERIHARYASHAKTNGPCSAAHCDLEITLDHWDAYRRIGKPSRLELIATKARGLAGGRWAIVVATVSTRDGVVWGKDFIAEMPHREDYALIAEAQTTPNFDLSNAYLETDPHPNIHFGRPNACTICQMLWARFTPYASANDIRDAFAFDLSCMGSTLRRCTEMSQIMPVAAQRLHENRWSATYPVPGDFGWSPTDVLRRYGRDAEYIAVMEISKVYPKQFDDQGLETQRVSFKVIDMLKGQSKIPSQPVTFYLRHSHGPESANNLAPVPHQKLITFWGGIEPTPLIAPVTNENLEEVRAGIAEDAVDIPKHW